MFDLIVIGAGPGGYEAAAHAGRMGKKVALIEKERVGGACLNVGCIPAKTFLRSSKLFRECREAAAFGVLVGEPQFDMATLLARKNRIVKTLSAGIDGMLKRAKVERISGHARLTSRTTVAVGDQSYETRNILIATGSRPAIPPIPGIDSDIVVDSNSVFALESIPRRIAIIGGGYIGLEFACFFNELGAEVSVVEMLPRIAAGGDEEISRRLEQILRRSGIAFHLSAKVLAVGDDALEYESSDGKPASVAVDCVLNAAGQAPVVSELGLEDAGVDFSAQGIRTADTGRTNLPGVWACGDVAGGPMLAHAATREGIVAVNNMFGKRDRVRRHALPAVVFTHPEVASVGKTEEELKTARIEYRKSVVPMAVAGRFLVEHEGGSGMVKVLVGARYGQILGVHAIGDSSSEFIVAAAVMVETEMGVAAASQIIFPHPTVSEALQAAIRGAE